ncbi:neuronal PAS domain-containing protein 2 [Zeugodacus cucurbitae]|nr:neuronal PAS domain-containing protein 2 [Zeugodacus cucurbitae]
MSQLGTVYATKRRRRNGKSLKPPPKDGVTKSNPSKRHRERLNAELDLLASLLPFEQNILSKLDRLSILRLSVSYLRTKSYFQVVMHKDKEENGMLPHIHTHAHDGYRTRELGAFEHGLLDGDMFLQALNGFLMILTCEGEVFFATHSIESYLGFHQSDIVHQSVYELVHSEDREELQRQLLWNSFLPADMSTIQLADTLAPDKALYLERSFTVRFRCLLDNTSGFLRLDIRGRIKILHGQNRKTEEPPLALFAYCTPFGPPSLLEIPHKENMFKSKHKLDFSLVSMDQRGKHVLGYSDAELGNMGGYDLVHYDDLAYVASAHQELLKTGASGMIAYRYQKKNGEWQWLQTSSRLVYKNSKPDFVICTHRQLMDEEGHDLLGKRTMDFKVSYLDTGLASTYFSEAEQLVVPPSTSPNALPPPVTPTRPNRRYKTQLRDFLSTCRTKRKMQQQQPQQSSLGQVTSPAPVVEYLPDPAVAVAAAYSNLNPMYTTSPYATAADNIYMGTSVHSTNFYPVTENLFHQYRLQGVSSYYTDYHHTGAPASAYVTNGFLPYDGYTIAPKDDKWQETGKYYSGYSSGYGSPTSTPQQVPLKTPKSSPHVMEVVSCSSDGPSPIDGSATAAAAAAHAARIGSSTNITVNGVSGSGGSATPKLELAAPQQDQYERQTVLMWGSQSSGIPINSIGGGSSRRHHSNAERSPQSTPLTNGLSYANNNNNENEVVSAKWNGSASVKDVKNAATPDSYQLQHDDSGLYSSSSHTTSPQQQQHQQQQVAPASQQQSIQRSSGNSVAEQQLSNTTATHLAHSLTQQQHLHTHMQHTTASDMSTPSTATANNLPLHSTRLSSSEVGSTPTTAAAVAAAAAAAAAASAAHQHAQSQHAAAAAAHHHAHHHSHAHAHTHPHAAHAHTHPHHHHHHAHAHAAHVAANSSEVLLNHQQQQHQQQQLEQLELQQLSYANQLQILPGCNSTASSSSSPTCHSPSAGNGATTLTNSVGAAAGAHIALLNGGSSNGSDTDIQSASAVSAAASAAAAAAYHHHHQLTIIAPIVITPASMMNGDGALPLSTALQPIHGSEAITTTTALNGIDHNLTQRSVASSHHHTAQLLSHTALAYAPNAATATYLISGSGGPTVLGAGSGNSQQGSIISNGISEHIMTNGNPLCSFSEVTNTLLNQ